jgi:hypothetical protein
MYQCPIDFYMDNLIFNADKSCWAAYRLKGQNYDHLSDKQKTSRLYQLASLCEGIMSDAQILVLPIEEDVEEHFSNIKKRLNSTDVLHTSAISQIDKTKDYLKSGGGMQNRDNDYATYFVVKLDEAAEFEVVNHFGDVIRYFIKDPVNAINVQMNLDTKDILKTKLEAFRKLADQWKEKNNLKMRLEPLSLEETQWLFRRMAYRGTGQGVKLFYQNQNKDILSPLYDEIEVSKDSIIKPYHRDVVNLFSGAIGRIHRGIKVSTGFTDSYQTFLTIANLPDEKLFPGEEWIYELQKQNLKAEVCIHIKISPHRAALEKIDKQKTGIKSQKEHILNAKAKIPDDLKEADFYAGEMESEIKEKRSPLLNTSITICLADSDPEKLEKRCDLVKALYDKMNIVVERPLTDQVKLYFSLMPSVTNTIGDFVLKLTPRTLASGIIGVTRSLGDNRGPYIGTTGKEKKPVYFALELAALMNMSPAATFFGDLGVGKSFNANLLIYLLVLYGGYGLILDPKGERGHWAKELTALKGLINIITLGNKKEDKGKLDPYNMYPDDIAEADELALNILADLCGISPQSDEDTVILDAQKRMKLDPAKNCMKKLIRMMYEMSEKDKLYDRSISLARNIELKTDSGMAALLVGDGTEKPISLNNRLNIIQIQNLKLPERETPKEEYSREQVLSTIIFGQATAFAKKFALIKRPVPKGVLVDESWLVSASKQGRSMEEFISRMGRSLFTSIIYNGHTVTDLPTEGIKSSITYKFVFRCANNDEEAVRLLEYIGLEPTPENLSKIKNFKSGECFFKDMYGRVGVLEFDAVFQDLIDVFDTTPKEGETEETQAYEEIEQEVNQEIKQEIKQKKIPAEEVVKKGTGEMDKGESVTEINLKETEADQDKEVEVLQMPEFDKEKQLAMIYEREII